MTKDIQRIVLSVLGAFFALLLGISAKELTQIFPTEETSVEVPEGMVHVTRVVDGDTFKAEIKGEELTVRIIGIDTPESVDPRTTVECFGIEASKALEANIEGRNVILAFDESQGDVDKYGRLLRYVTNEEGVDVGEWLIKTGYAYEYTYNTPYERQEAYKSAQEFARDTGSGLWSSETCNGER